MPMLDVIRTVVNVSGDAVISGIVAKSEAKLDVDVINDPEAGIYDWDDAHILVT